MKEFLQIEWDEPLVADCRQIVRLAVREDLDRWYDWTTVALVPSQVQGRAAVVARQSGVVAGLPAASLALEELEIQAGWQPQVAEGQSVEPGAVIAELSGPARDLLTSERLLLNLIGRLSGIATLTGRYVQRVAGTGVRIYDTRKTTPGWRRLEKYAVRCGGGRNHRGGLFDAVLIKDNHLALAGRAGKGPRAAAWAVEQARRFVHQMLPGDERAGRMIIEVEVDTLQQLEQVLPTAPDIVLLDNMTPEQLRQAVALRNAAGSSAELEASGGINLDTVRAVAETGVERISVGGLTHSAISLDVGLDWLE